MKEATDFRPMRRFKQQLPKEECEEILSKAYRGFLAVNGDDGYPYTVPVNFVYSHGHIYLHSAVSGHKVDAIKKSPKACFTVIDDPIREENDWWYHVRSVICFGDIRIIEDEDERIELLRLFGGKYFPEGYDINKELTHNAPHTLVLDFDIAHITGKRVNEN